MLNRREAVSRIAMMVGGSLSAPTLFAMQAKEAGKKQMADAFTLSPTQRQIVAAVAEHIIPKTDTAGAIEAGVPAFIELMLTDCYHKPEHMSFKKGLADLEKAKFLSLNQDGQVAVLTLLESNTKELMKGYQQSKMKVGDNLDKEATAINVGVPFWRLMKELTLLGYYTSEKGIAGSFIYEPIPGKFEAIKIKPGQKSYQY